MTLDLLPVLLAAGVLQQAPADQACGPVRGFGDAIGWLICQAEAHSAALIAIGTIGLFIVGVLRLLRDEGGTEKRTNVADSQIAGLAKPVRRTLENSLDESWRLEDAPPARKRRARDLQRGFVEHESRVEDMLAEAAYASPEVADAVHRVADLFWDAAHGVNEMEAVDLSTHDAEVPEDVQQRFREAKVMTEKCVDELDALIEEAGS